MKIIYPYQTSFLIATLTEIAERLETVNHTQWFALSSAAACLETLLNGTVPDDIADVSLRLKNLSIPNPFPRLNGRSIYHAVNMAITLIDGHRLGLLVIQPAQPVPPPIAKWIGFDQGTGDRTVFGDRHV